MSSQARTCEALEDRLLLSGVTADIDGDGQFTPLGDGVLAARFMAGFRGTDLVEGAVNPAGRRTDPDEIVAFLQTDEMQEFLDLDGDGELNAGTDGVLLIRGLARFTDTVLTQNATGSGATRTTPGHVTFLADNASTSDDTAAAVEGMKLFVPTEEGLLLNDPIGATIISFDRTSMLGASVNVAADGNYTYDPAASDELNQLSPSESRVDSFTYTINTAAGNQVVNVLVAVAGAASDGQDLISTDDNTPIGFEFEKGQPFPTYNVLDNDSGAGLTVVAFDETSVLGARIEIDPDGTLRYNPTVSDKLNSLNGTDVLQDTFTYTTQNSQGQQQEPVTVTVAVSGANDSPVASAFFATATAGGTSITLDPLEFVSDIDAGDVLTIIDADLVTPFDRPDFGTVTLNGDGSVTYDLSSASRINDRIPAGDVFRVRLFYRVQDSAGHQDTADIFVDVTGQRHAPHANPDDYTVSSLIPEFTTGIRTFINAASAGLMRNDDDIDGDSVFMVSVGEFMTQRGATVTINVDGSFLYDPTGSSELLALSAGDVVTDTFTYTINDSANDGESQGTAILEVKGHDFARNPVIDLSGLADTSTGGARVTVSSFIVPLNPPQEIVNIVDETTGNGLAVFLRSIGSTTLLDSLTIRGTTNDTIRANTGLSLPLYIFGEGGNDDLLGGDASDFIDGGPGNDVLFGGGEADVFVGQSGNDIFDFEAIDRIVDLQEDDQVLTQLSGALNRTPTPAQLNATGEMTVRLVDYGMFGNFVTITGPTGYGFQLDGSWNSTQHPNGSETFSGTNVFLKTAAGSIPLGAVSLNAGPDTGAPISNRGPLVTSNNGLFSALDVLTNNPIINEINQFTGITFNSTQLQNQGLTFGLKLGSELMANELSGFSAPLNNAIPYLFAQFNLGTNLVNFGGDDNVSVSSSNSVRLAFVFDPADPFFWLRGEVNGIGGSIGFSRQGNIPFRPSKKPDAVPSSKQIFGNVTGSIKLPVKEVFRVEGLVVLDYDRNYGPGNYSGNLDDELIPNEFARLFKDSSADLEDIVTALSNTELGVNGAITFTPKIGGGLGLSLPIASGTAMFFGGKTFAFQGGTDDPFASIDLLQTLGLNPGTIKSDGYFQVDTLDFRVEVEATQGNGKFGPFSTTGDLSFVIDNNGMSLNFGLDTPVASSRFSGNVAFQDTTETIASPFGTLEYFYPAGTFELTARVSPLDIDFVVGTARASMTLSITNREFVSLDFDSGVVTYQAGAVQVGLSMSFTLRSPLLDVDLSANVDFSVAGNGEIRFSGTLRGTIAFGFGPVGAEFGISNDGIRLQIDWLGIDTNIPFPFFLHASPVITGKQLADRDLLEAVAITAITDEAIRRLEDSGLTNDEVAVLRSVTYRVEDRDNREQIVGYASGLVVTLDRDAAGHGWFIDATREDDSEFDTLTRLADVDSQAFDRIDLLSVIKHELTHVLEATWPKKVFDFGEVETELIGTGQRFAVEPSSSSDRRQEG